jgi:hypothetical protein
MTCKLLGKGPPSPLCVRFWKVCACNLSFSVHLEHFMMIHMCRRSLPTPVQKPEGCKKDPLGTAHPWWRATGGP